MKYDKMLKLLFGFMIGIIVDILLFTFIFMVIEKVFFGDIFNIRIALYGGMFFTLIMIYHRRYEIIELLKEYELIK